MRPASILAVLLTVAPIARADDITSYTLLIAAPRYTFITESALLLAECGANTEGCTHITGTAFSADCVSRSDSWRMAPTLSFIPYMYLPMSSRRDHVVDHELLHIDDMRRWMETYVRDIAGTRFPSLVECRAAVALEHDRIEDVARSLARKSFELRR